MTFGESIQTVLFKKYADFTGRAMRSEYWFFVLFEVIINTFLSTLSGIYSISTGTMGINIFSIILWIFLLAFFIPSLAVSIRRLHDIGKSGWNSLLALIPLIGAIILIVFFCKESNGENQYGPKPQ